MIYIRINTTKEINNIIFFSSTLVNKKWRGQVFGLFKKFSCGFNPHKMMKNDAK